MFWRKKNKSQPKKEKDYVFKTWETREIGDYYKYTIKATSQKEAFKKLVIWFFGESKTGIEVDQESGDIQYEGNSHFVYEGMPYWFAKRIGGYVRNHNNAFQKQLEKYCIDNDIVLDKK